MPGQYWSLQYCLPLWAFCGRRSFWWRQPLFSHGIFRALTIVDGARDQHQKKQITPIAGKYEPAGDHARHMPHCFARCPAGSDIRLLSPSSAGRETDAEAGRNSITRLRRSFRVGLRISAVSPAALSRRNHSRKGLSMLPCTGFRDHQASPGFPCLPDSNQWDRRCAAGRADPPVRS